jgi:hypothetical protein
MFEDVAKSLGLSETVVNSIPKDLREDKSFEPIKDFTGLVTSYRDGQKMIGRGIFLPEKEAKPEDKQKAVDSIFKKLTENGLWEGAPESPDKYNLALPKPDKIDWQDDKLKMFKEAGHKYGLNHKQMHGILDLYANMVEAGDKLIETGKQAALQELTKDWGPQEGASYQRNMALVKRAVDIYGGPETKEFFNAVTEVGNHPLLVRMIAKMAADLDEADYLGGEEGGGGMTSDEAKAKIAAIYADPKDLYHAKFQGQPGHDERVAEVEKLYQLAYPRM